MHRKKERKNLWPFTAEPLQQSIFVVRINFKIITVSLRILSIIFLFAACTSQRQSTSEAESLVSNLKSHVEYLSNDKLEGRRTGTAGEKLAWEYIAGKFTSIGLQPKGTNAFLQAFDVAEGKELTTATNLTLNGNALTNADFFPLVYSGNGTINATPSISLMERGEPWFLNLGDMLAENKSNPHFDINGALVDKAKDAAQKGASAFIVYNLSANDDGLKFESKDRTETVIIPVVYIAKATAKKYFADASASLKITGNIEVKEKKRSGNNVVGYIDNGAANTVILGAHFDHLGYGEDHNSRHTGTDKQIHNGADDNASGTAALIELARMIKASSLKNNNYLFIAFSGEELGLYGSKYFTQNPTIDLSTVNFMINMDMVGRLNDSSRTLTVGGYGTSPSWGEIYNRGGTEKLFEAAQYRFDSSGTGPSDHTSFYTKNIPVLFYFTGLHTDYHKPSDDFDKINYSGQSAIVKHIYSLLQAANKMNTKLAFTKTREAQMNTTARFSVTLGIMPDYTYNGAGVRADGVTDGRPAQKAGIKAGDIITSIGDYKVSSMESYMQTLGKFKKGDKTTVNYTRAAQALVANVEF